VEILKINIIVSFTNGDPNFELNQTNKIDWSGRVRRAPTNRYPKQ